MFALYLAADSGFLLWLHNFSGRDGSESTDGAIRANSNCPVCFIAAAWSGWFD